MQNAQVGIFFVVNDELIFDQTNLEGAEIYGDALNFSGHYEYWENLSPTNSLEYVFKNQPYDYFPRGRVVFFKNHDKYRIYVDRCIKPSCINKIATLFGLSDYHLANDEHYKCSICNPTYLD